MEIKNLKTKKYDYLLNQNKDYMDLTALSFGKRKITYEQMHDRIEKYAKMLYAKGVREGDVIGVCALNTPESVYLLYALDVIGAVVVGLSPLDNKDKMRQDIELTRPKMVISVDMAYSNFKEYEKALNFSTILYSPMHSVDDKKLKFGYNLLQLKNGNFKLSGEADLFHLLKKDYSPNEFVASSYKEGVSDIMFTGGSTGVHKGVELDGSGLNFVVDGMDKIFDVYPGMIHLGNIPIGHMVYGRMIMHYTLCHNMEYAMTLKAMPKDFYDELVRTGANAAVGGPPHWVSLIEQQGDKFVPSSKLKSGSLSQLYYATSGGEAKKANTDDAINLALKYCGSPARVGDGLGATETWSSILISNRYKNSDGTLGKPIGNVEIKLVNSETGKIVSPGEKGLLYVSGPTIMLGYHKNPEETAKVISYDENGKRWCNLGDFLSQEESGEYKYVGRKKRNFVSGIENIYPEQIEDLLIKLPEVREAIVTAIPDEMVQYVPSYHISLYGGDIDKEDFENRMCQLIESCLSSSWLPGSIEYFDEPLKRMANTKIDVSYYAERDKELASKEAKRIESAKQLRLSKM